MERMKIIPRIIESRLRQALERQKSVLLLGPRQTGKTTLVESLQPDLLLNFLRPEVRQRYESVGFDVDPMGPEAMLQHMRKLWSEFGPLIRQLGIRAE